MSIITDTCAALERLRVGGGQNDGYLPAKWDNDPSTRNEDTSSAPIPSSSKLGSVKVTCAVTPGSIVFHPPLNVTSPLSAPYPGLGHGSSISAGAGSLDLGSSMPAIARRHRVGILPDTYPFGSLSRKRQPLPNDHIELMLERTGELPSSTKDLEIERFQ